MVKPNVVPISYYKQKKNEIAVEIRKIIEKEHKEGNYSNYSIPNYIADYVKSEINATEKRVYEEVSKKFDKICELVLELGVYLDEEKQKLELKK